MAAKDEVDGSDVSKMIYSFGPRFFVEVTYKIFCYSMHNFGICAYGFAHECGRML